MPKQKTLRQSIETLTENVDKLFVKVTDMENVMATKTDVHDAKDELLTHIDGLSHRTERVEQELVARRARDERLGIA